MRRSKKDFTASILDLLKARFGNAAKSFWVYEDDRCPCCMNPVDFMIYEGKKTLSINGFMYREKGVLIGYLMCGQCANAIMAHLRYEKTDMHVTIEANLISAYKRYMASLDA